MTPAIINIIDTAKIMFARRLTDLAGGNVSIRDGDTIFITPRYAGSRLQWNLQPEDIVCGPVLSDELKSNPSFSREGITHLTVYRAFPFVNAIIHAHPFHVLPFCAANKPIPPVLSATKRYGEIRLINNAPAYSQEQAELIVADFKGKEALLRDYAAAVLLPAHGIFIAGKDLKIALDVLERIDINAWCILAQKLI